MAKKRLLGTTPEADGVEPPSEPSDAGPVDDSFWVVATIHEIDAMQRPTWRLHQRGALVALMPWSHYPRQRTFAMWRDGPQTTVADSSTEGFEFIPQLVG
jgi:hypothetical protein